MKTTWGHRLATFAMMCMALTVQATEPATHPGNVTDLALTAVGDLSGTIVDDQGHPLANTPVQVLHNRTVVALVKSDSFGRYAVRGLRPGLHLVRTVNNQKLCRFWNATTAPPSAATSLTLASSATIVRGQSCCDDGCGESCGGNGCGESCGGRGLLGGCGCGLLGGPGGFGGGLLPVAAIGGIAAATIATTTGNNDERPVFAQRPASP